MRFPRITVKRLLVIVPTATILTWGGVEVAGLLRLRTDYLSRAAEHQRLALEGMTEANNLAEAWATSTTSKRPTISDFIKFNETYIHYHEQLGIKYQLAAMQPWLKPSPDPDAPRILQPLPLMEPAMGFPLELPDEVGKAN